MLLLSFHEENRLFAVLIVPKTIFIIVLLTSISSGALHLINPGFPHHFRN
jgi:hypothetical protein